MRFSMAAGRVRRSEIRDFLSHGKRDGVISLAGGLPANLLFDFEGVTLAVNEAMSSHRIDALQYGPTEGQDRLRLALSELMAKRGIKTSPENVVVTTGSQQGIDLIARSFIDPGDWIVVERPSYLAALQSFQLAGARFVTLPSDGDGAEIDKLDSILGERKPKLIYLVSTFANPTGATLAEHRRKSLLRWAKMREVFVVEDDPYGALRFNGQPVRSLLELAEDIPGAAKYCCYLSSLSKIIAPGLRIGWMTSNPEVVDTLIRVKQSMDLHTSSFTQEVAAAYLGYQRLDNHLSTVTTAYATQCHALSAALRDSLGNAIDFNSPSGGLFLWARLSEGISARKLIAFAARHGVLYVPGDAFYPEYPDSATLRLSYSNISVVDARSAAQRLASAVREFRASQVSGSKEDVPREIHHRLNFTL